MAGKDQDRCGGFLKNELRETLRDLLYAFTNLYSIDHACHSHKDETACRPEVKAVVKRAAMENLHSALLSLSDLARFCPADKKITEEEFEDLGAGRRGVSDKQIDKVLGEEEEEEEEEED